MNCVLKNEVPPVDAFFLFYSRDQPLPSHSPTPPTPPLTDNTYTDRVSFFLLLSSSG